MLSSVLRSDRAVQVNVAIMRAFLQLRAMLATLRQMLETPISPKRQIGFHARTKPA